MQFQQEKECKTLDPLQMLRLSDNSLSSKAFLNTLVCTNLQRGICLKKANLQICNVTMKNLNETWMVHRKIDVKSELVQLQCEIKNSKWVQAVWPRRLHLVRQHVACEPPRKLESGCASIGHPDTNIGQAASLVGKLKEWLILAHFKATVCICQ